MQYLIKTKNMFVKGWFIHSFVSNPDDATNYGKFLRGFIISKLNKQYGREYLFQPANFMKMETNMAGKNEVKL